MDNSCTLYIRILFIAGPRNPAMTTLNKKYSVIYLGLVYSHFSPNA